MVLTIKVFPTGSLGANLVLAFNEATKKALLFDPGEQNKEVDKILREKELTVDGIILTHGHFDHVYGVPYYKKLTGAVVYMDMRDHFLLQGNTQLTDLLGIPTPDNYPFKVDVNLKGKKAINICDTSITLLHTPGHSPGSVTFVIPEDSDGVPVVICGDTIFKTGFGRTDLPGGSQKTLMESLELLHNSTPAGSSFISGHGSPFAKADASFKMASHPVVMALAALLLMLVVAVFAFRTSKKKK